MTDYLDTIEQVKLLAKYRAELQLKRKVIADAIGVTSQAIKNWEQGRNQPLPAFQKRVAVTLEALRESVRRKCKEELAKPKKTTWRRGK